MVEENKQRREALEEAFRSQEQKKYWELWRKYSGDSSRVASECGVTKSTVSEHVRHVVVSMGFSNIAEARLHFGYASRSRDSHGSPTTFDLTKLLEVQSYKCALTGVRLEANIAELDHKVPLSRGGTNEIGNLQWVHKEVNRAKGTMDNDEFITMCRKVAKNTPRVS